MPDFFSPSTTEKCPTSEEKSSLLSQQTTNQAIPHVLVQSREQEEKSAHNIPSSSSDEVMSLKRLYAHYSHKQLQPPPSPFLEDLGLETAATEATASYAAWKKMQDRLAQLFATKNKHSLEE